MRKGQKKRIWTPEQKAEIVYKHLNDHSFIEINEFYEENGREPSLSKRT